MILLEGLEEEEDFTVDHYYEPSSEWLFYSTNVSPHFEQKFEELMEQLKKYGIIGEDPMKYWSRNQIQTRQSVNLLEGLVPEFTIIAVVRCRLLLGRIINNSVC